MTPAERAERDLEPDPFHDPNAPRGFTPASEAGEPETGGGLDGPEPESEPETPPEPPPPAAPGQSHDPRSPEAPPEG